MADRYVTPHDLPEGYERELLVILQEECAEVITHTAKALRFGLEDGYPGSSTTNRADIAVEVAHVVETVAMLIEVGVLDVTTIEAHRPAKREKVRRFLQSDPPAETT